MCLGAAVQVWGIEVSLSCPDIDSLESRKIIDKPTVLVVPRAHLSSAHVMGSVRESLGTASALSPHCCLAARHFKETMWPPRQKFSTCLIPLGSEGN